MRTRIATAIALLAIVSTIVVPFRGTKAEAAGPEIPTFAKSVISLVPGGSTVLAGVNTAYEIEAWASGTQTVDVQFLDDTRTHHVNLGYTYRLPFRVNYAYDENTPWDDTFLEIYAIKDEQVIYFKRVPEQGYFKADTSGTINGEIQLGAKQYSASGTPEEIELIAVLYEDDTVGWDNSEGRHARPPYGDPSSGITQQHHYVGGRGVVPFSIGDNEVRQTPRHYNPYQQRARAWKVLGGMHVEAIDKEKRQIQVRNPFFIHETKTDNGADKSPGETFVHQFEAWANYSEGSSLSVIPPERPIADVTVSGFGSSQPWTWQRAPGASFQLRTEGSSSVGVNMAGQDTSHHPGTTITYETALLLRARGQNHIEYEVAGSRNRQLRNQVYAWEGVFRRAADLRELLPITYTVTSTEHATVTIGSGTGSVVAPPQEEDEKPQRPVTGTDSDASGTGTTAGAPATDPTEPSDDLPGLDDEPDDEELPGMEDDPGDLPGLDDDDLPGLDDDPEPPAGPGTDENPPANSSTTPPSDPPSSGSPPNETPDAGGSDGLSTDPIRIPVDSRLPSTGDLTDVPVLVPGDEPEPPDDYGTVVLPPVFTGGASGGVSYEPAEEEPVEPSGTVFDGPTLNTGAQFNTRTTLGTTTLSGFSLGK